MSLPQVAITLVKEADFLIEETEDELVITGTAFSIPEFIAQSWSAKNLTIRAYELTLMSSLFIPGKRITIYTQTLKTVDEISISVSGRKQKDWEIPAPSGAAPGDHGGKGEPGRNGENAGSITIVSGKFEGSPIRLEANGSDGRQGQRGGDGAIGHNGIDAEDASGNRSTPAPSGGEGGQGGNAGQGGKGGVGGNGGTIAVYCSHASAQELISTSVAAGKPGKPGENGQAGAGGKGGNGGRGLSCRLMRPIIR